MYLAIFLAHPVSNFCYNGVIISLPKKIIALDLVRKHHSCNDNNQK
jgi:hypothetical protein